MATLQCMATREIKSWSKQIEENTTSDIESVGRVCKDGTDKPNSLKKHATDQLHTSSYFCYCVIPTLVAHYLALDTVN